MNYKIILEYDGTDYHGFQIQLQLPTVQLALENAIARLGTRESPIYAAGRTDTGVHARGQVISFRGSMKPEIRRLPSALNAFLPGDIVARDCSEEDDSFNARRSALAREYIYYIHLSRFPSPFNRRFTYHCDSTLDLENMASALEMTVGKRDFAAFARSERGKTTVREVQEAGIFAKGDIVAIQVRANAFIWMMMRMLCGSLLEVGRGKWSIDRFHEALESCDNSNSAAALPPHGLVLEQVHY